MSWSARQDPVLGGRRRRIGRGSGPSLPPHLHSRGCCLAPGVSPLPPSAGPLTWHHAGGGEGDRMARKLLELRNLYQRRGVRSQRRPCFGRGPWGYGHSPQRGSQPHTDPGRKSPVGTKWGKGDYCDKSEQFGQSLLPPASAQVLLPSLPHLNPPSPGMLPTPPTVPPHLVGREKDGA